ncbi:hypothetical protein PYCCODRAFT_1465784 [Trametes coccinea BRFM310]|uniref:DUF6534 domain-containing protein n=1 Tax=Trametes coccinea (strain BRFM310) TaxID=1353009 RepID=A0A1Y2IW32_TRAC3|nr:hypothetical protein PYCCODRAFT_1465784 [Trametes coccinea BRFM310]
MSSTPSTTVPPVSLDESLGAFFIGAMIGLVLYGMSLQQTIQYFRLYPNDRRLFKAWVVAIAILETLHSICSVHPMYYYLIKNYDNPAGLVKNIWSLNIISPLQTGAMILSQSFYARRIFMLNRKYGLMVLITTSALMAAELAFSLTAAIKPFQDTYTFNFYKYAWAITGLNACAIPVDMILTGTLIFILLRNRTGFERTDSVIATIVLYVINTGLLTGLVTITTLVLSRVFPTRYYEVGMTIAATKVYSNTFLAMLNSRQFISNRLLVDEFDGVSGDLRSLSFAKRSMGGVATLMFPETSVSTVHIFFLGFDLLMESRMVRLLPQALAIPGLLYEDFRSRLRMALLLPPLLQGRENKAGKIAYRQPAMFTEVYVSFD